jgi:membrane protein
MPRLPFAPREDTSPWRLGGLGVRELARRVYAEIWEDEVLDRAAALSYYFLFALFPALLFLTALIGLAPWGDLMGRFMQYVSDVLPPDAASLLSKTLAEVLRGARGGLVSVGAAASLWAASSAMASIMAAMNVAYDVTDPRPWWKQRAIAVGLTLVFSVFTVTALLLMVFGPRIAEAVANLTGLGPLFVSAWAVLEWPVAAVVVVTGIALVYYLAPAVKQRWYWVTPGSVFALAMWLLASIGLRLYVQYVGSYNATYGSIGGVILLLLWLYLAGVSLLVGAEINAEIEHAAAEHGERTAKAPGERVAPAERGARARTSASR